MMDLTIYTDISATLNYILSIVYLYSNGGNDSLRPKQ